MFDSPGNAYMQIAIEHSVGDLRLDVSCEFRAPWTVLFGPSGAGKTSLLRLVGGLDRPLIQPLDKAVGASGASSEKRSPGLLNRTKTRTKTGRVVFRGRTFMDVERNLWTPPGERGIGFVTQRPALFPHMDVAANVGFGIHGVSRSAREERVAKMLRLFAVEPLAGRKPKALSGGEKQRVALARALAPEPQLLLLDEPFTGLDAPLKESILKNLTHWLEQRNIPAIYVSHDVAEAFQTGAEVIVLRHGAVQAQGAPTMVLAEERDRLLQHLGPELEHFS